MIITCPSCEKKFEIDTNLIPDDGRDLQCGSCDHIWFYKKEKEIIEPTMLDANLIKEEIKPNIPKNIQNDNSKKNQIKSKEDLKENKIYKKKVDSINFARILYFIIVFIISILAAIVLLDTFKSPLSIIFPNLERLLFSLFETVKDIILFTKNLFF